MRQFNGIIPPVITVFDEEEKVDFQKTGDFIDHLIEAGVHGIFIAGSTGEYTLLSKSERKELIEKAVEVVNGRVPLLAGTGANDTRTAIKFSKYAEEVGADAATVALPHYPKPSQSGLYEHYKKISEEITIPILVYNWPNQHAGLNVDPEIVGRLAEEGLIDGIKDSSDLTWGIEHLAEVKRLTGDSISVFTGFANHLLPALSLGADGSVCTVGNIIPEKVVSIYELFMDGQLEEARSVQLEILPVINSLEVDPAAVKTALRILGFDVGYSPCPIVEPSHAAEEAIKEALESVGVLN